MKTLLRLAALAAVAWCASAATHIQITLTINDGTTAAKGYLYAVGPKGGPHVATSRKLTIGTSGVVDEMLKGCPACYYDVEYHFQDAQGRNASSPPNEKWFVPDTATTLTSRLQLLGGSAAPANMVNQQQVNAGGLLPGQLWLWDGTAWAAAYPASSSDAGVADPGANGVMYRDSLNHSIPVTGTPTDCVKVDGTSGPCGAGAGGSNTFAALVDLPTDNTALANALSGKAATSHGHTIPDVTALQPALDGKSAIGHGHAIANVTGLQTALDARESVANKGAVNGYASLDAGGKVPAYQLPSSSGMTAILQDVAPQLGGSLDMNGFAIQSVTPTEMARIHGLTSPVQTQLDGKSATGHNHSGVYEPVDITLLRQSNLAGSGAATTPARSDHNHSATYQAIITGAPGAWPSTFAPSAHASAHASAGADPLTLAQSQITGLVTGLAGKQATSEKDANGGYVGRDSSGNATIPGTLSAGAVSTGQGGSAAGFIELGQGTAPSVGTNAVTLYAPTGVTSYKLRVPAAGFTGLLLGTNTAGDVVLSAVTGTATDCVHVDGSSGACGGGALPTDSGNKVLASPANGSSGVVAARVLVPADLPGEYYALSTGSANAYVVAPTTAVTSYVTGEKYYFKASFSNTGAASVNFSGVGNVTIKKPQGAVTTDLVSNDVRSGQMVAMMFDGTNMQMVSQLGNAAGGATVATTTSILKGDGAGNAVAASAGDVPTLNQNTSGTAANLSGTPALPNGTTATTQTVADNSTKLATTAYADTAAAARAASNATATVNGQTVTLGTTNTLTADPTSAKFKTLRVLGYEIPGTGTAGVLQAADFTASFAAAINDANAKTLTEASCISDTGDQTIVVSVGGSARFTIHCVVAGSYSRGTTDGSTGYIIAASMTNTAIAAGAALDVTGTANGSTKDVKVFAYGTVN